MQTVTVNTSQNVNVEYQIASLGDRILALIIDWIVIVVYMILVVLFASFTRNIGLGNSTAFLIILYLPAFLYDLICEVFFGGQSFGKYKRGIKVVKLDGSKPGLGSYLLRWVFRIIDNGISYGSVALITFLVNGKGQRLGDIAAGTTVIKLTMDSKIEDTIFTEIEENYSPVFPQAADLDDQTIALIKEVLNADVEEDRMGKVSLKLAWKMQHAIEKKLGIESDYTPRAFLEIIMKDYNYLKLKN